MMEYKKKEEMREIHIISQVEVRNNEMKQMPHCEIIQAYNGRIRVRYACFRLAEFSLWRRQPMLM